MSSTTTPEVEKEPLTLITLVSSDGERFEIEEAVALQSQTIKHMVEDGCSDNGIPLPNVAGKHLAKVIEYLKKHQYADHHDDEKSSTTDEEDVEEEKKKKQAAADVKAFDEEFVKSAEEERVMFELILAANYLNIKGLLDLTCQAVVDSIKDKMPKDIRTIFNIENDFTPEEEAVIRNENAWAFQID